MGYIAAVKAATSAVFGTGVPGSGGVGGTQTTDVNIFDPVIARNIVDGLDAGDLYETQPHLRTVVSFVARNGAQLGRHVYTRDAEDNRTRVRDSAAAQVLAKPNDYQTGFDLFNHLFSELALYDFALWVPVLRDGRWQIDPIPGSWIVGTKSNSFKQVTKYKVQPPGAASWYFIEAKDAVAFRGYSPEGFKAGSSAVKSLKGTLGEQVSAMEFRRQMWQRGGRVGMFMSRPKDAPEWSPEAKAKFIQNWKNSWAGSGANAGSTPLLEDGMELKRVGFTAKEEQWIEAATLSLATVAGAYHVPPSMVGVQGATASFASVKEFRKMLYTETLGPLVAQVEDTINQFLFPLIGEAANHYFELNISEKLQGDFEEQGNVLFQAVGGPYMTPDEARKKVNLGPIEGGDRLLVPLNMGAAGNNGPAADEPIDPEAAESAPADETAPKTRNATHGDRARGEKAQSPTPYEDTEATLALMADLKAFFGRQERAIAKATSGKDPEWWDQKKWNQELSATLLPHFLTVSTGTARRAAGAKGLDPDGYSVAETKNFLDAVSASRADLINATTREQLEEAFRDQEVPREDAVKHVFTVAQESRAAESTVTMTTFLMAWATVEMAKQLVADKGPTKTWISSGKANSRHSGMNGETVPINEKFSNGADWPGDPVLGAAGVSNCACGVDINYND
ncbi:portal protein [Microbacterium phage Franklin22]|uniref:portal protein n=1 Tax=Microbacterium phage Franklin22 TaxID=2894293 RepID=UPI001E75C3AA|nr:portal protein [Microbacterium phage Franklin22]UGL61816.1 portal protein [Microbacterium phage Franklin22]